MTHVTCRLTAKNRDQLRNPTLLIEYGLPFLLQQRVCCHVAAQLVSGELEYVHMHHPPSLDRRAAPPTSAPRTQQGLYDVPRTGATALQPTTKLGLTAKDAQSENINRRSVGSETKRSPTDPMRAVTPVPPVGRAPADELPYAVAGMAVRLPPVGRRTQESRVQQQARRPVDEYGFIIAGGTQLPEATFI